MVGAIDCWMNRLLDILSIPSVCTLLKYVDTNDWLNNYSRYYTANNQIDRKQKLNFKN